MKKFTNKWQTLIWCPALINDNSKNMKAVDLAMQTVFSHTQYVPNKCVSPVQQSHLGGNKQNKTIVAPGFQSNIGSRPHCQGDN